MKEKLIELLNLDAKATEAEIVSAVGSLIAEPKAVKIDPRIREKMAAGLTFQQAAEIVASQEAADKQAKAEAKAAK